MMPLYPTAGALKYYYSLRYRLRKYDWYVKLVDQRNPSSRTMNYELWNAISAMKKWLEDGHPWGRLS